MPAYTNGVNLGGWLVMENWLFPNVLLLRRGENGIADNQEWNYIARMRERGLDAVGTMHAHYNGFLGGDLLGATEPPSRLLELAAAGVTSVRIPIGYWSLQPPTVLSDDARNGTAAAAMAAAAAGAPYDRPGLTEEGFVTGATVYLRAALRWMRALGMQAIVDVHSLPGGAVRNMGYTGRYFPSARFFDGTEVWASDGNASSLPSHSSAELREGVRVIHELAALLASLEEEPETAGVVRGLSPWNEALFADDALASRLLPRFALKLLPQLRRSLPAPRYDLILNFFNQGADWASWLAEHGDGLGGGVVADLHVYHAFDPPFDLSRPFEARGCPMCTNGEEVSRRTCALSSSQPDLARPA